ncbi:S8 family serine peptidase [Oligoflexia bacterium]|nr:S8 family serine peptidase [Oligoflexia bacterium]
MNLKIGNFLHVMLLVVWVPCAHAIDSSQTVLRQKPAYYQVSSSDLLFSLPHTASPQEEAALAAVPGTQVTRLNRQTFRIQITNPSQVTPVNRLLRLLDRQGIGVVGFNKPVIASLVVNDPDQQWYMSEPTGIAYTPISPNSPNLSQATAHDITSGSSQVKVAVIDLNPDELQSQMADLPAPNFSYVANPRTPNILPGMDHGTQVSAVIFSQQNNGLGISGVCPQCAWHAYSLHTILDPQLVGGRLSDLMSMLNKINQSDAQIVNMSWGMPESDPHLSLALRDLVDNGKLLFAAAGNLALATPMYPASDEKVVGVGAIQSDDLSGISTIWNYSNWGSEIVAPGHRIVLPRGISAPTGTAIFYSIHSGTSFASPHVAGVAALVMSEILERPAAYPYSSSLSSVDLATHIRSILNRSATDMGLPGKDYVFGNGLVNGYEALRTLESDNAPTLAPDLVQGISEWTQGSPGQPFLSRFQQRLSSTQPIVEYSIERSDRHGSCIFHGSYKFRQPKATTVINSAQIQYSPSLGGDLLTVTVTADIDMRFSQRVDFAPQNPLECIVGWDHNTFTVAWNGSPSNTTTFNITYRLRASGYERIAYQRTLPIRTLNYTFPTTGNGLSGHYASFLNTVEPVLEMMESAYVLELLAMTDEIVKATLSFDRLHTANYTKLRTQDSPAATDILLPVQGNPTARSTYLHDSANNQSESQLGVRAPKSSYQAGIAPMPAAPPTMPVSFQGSALDADVYTHENFYNSLLENYYARGQFSYLHNSFLTTLVQTETSLSGAGIAIQMDAELAHAPTLTWLTPNTPNDPVTGEITALVLTNVAIPAPVPYTAAHVVEFRVPITKRNIYKDRSLEKSGEARSSYYEERITPDFFAAEVRLLTGSGSPLSEISPGVPLDEREYEIFFKETLGFQIVRQYASLSGWRTLADKQLGSYGCLDDGLLGLSQQFSVVLNGIEAVTITDRYNCFDLDLGSWLPIQSPAHSAVNNFSRRELRFMRREAKPMPFADYAAAPQTFNMSHPTAANHFATYILHAVQATLTSGAEEVHTYFDGIASSDYAGLEREQVYLYEQLWQAHQMPSGTSNGTRSISKWVPNTSGAYLYEVITRPRNVEQLNVGDVCLPNLQFQFSYQSGVPPYLMYAAWASDYNEASIRGKDNWTALPPAACLEGGEGELNK